MAAHHRTEGPVLQPAHVEFLEQGVRGAGGGGAPAVVVSREEAAAVGIEIGIAREGEAQAGRNLGAEHVPGGVHVPAPGVGARALLAGIGRARKDHHAAGRDCFLVVIHPLDRHDREGVPDAAEGADAGLEVQVALLETVVVRLGGVHPPGIDAHLLEAHQVLPVDVPGLLRIRVVRLYARRVIHPRGPVGKARAGPGLEVEEQAFLVQLPVRLGHRAERGPDGNHQAGIPLVHLVDHRLGVAEVVVEELHRVPEVIIAPVLPVLDHAVDGDAARAVAPQHLQQLAAALVALPALHVAVAPQRDHRDVARQGTDARDHAVGIPAPDEIVVNDLPDLGLEQHPVRVVAENRRGRIVPEDAVTFDGLHDGHEVFGIVLDHPAGLAAQRQRAVLQDAQPVEGLVRLGKEGLADDFRALVEALGTGLEAPGAFFEQEFALGREELDRAVPAHADLERGAGVGRAGLRRGGLDAHRLRGGRHGETVLRGRTALDDADHGRRIELNGHSPLLRHQGQGGKAGQQDEKNAFHLFNRVWDYSWWNQSKSAWPPSSCVA